jgi:hypothetical protein
MPTQSDDEEFADSVDITFKMQTNDQKHDTVVHDRTDDSVVNRIWTYPRASLDTPVCKVWRNGHMEHITSKNTLQHLQLACSTVGSACLGFKPPEVGTQLL